MIKTIKVTSLIGLILEAFLSFLFLLFFVGSVSGISHSEIRTTINEQTTTKSTEMASLIFNWIFGVLMVASFISFIIGFTALKLMTKKTTMSAVFYIIGGVVSLNLITIVAWMICGILIFKNKAAVKEAVIEKNKIGNSWWIILAVAGIFSLLSIHGFIITIGAFGILALNIVWLTVYKPKSNGQAFESTAKPTIYLSIIGLFIMSVLMNILFYIVLYDDFFDIGLKLYGDSFHFLGKTLFFISILLFALGTIFAFQIQKARLQHQNSKQ